jgi:glycosyltransferase involved in cell wall biosynthesis
MRKKLLIATPIYPPEIGGPATYTKELAQRLISQYDIEIVTFGNTLSSPVFPNTKLHLIDNGSIMPIRLIKIFFKLILIIRNFDIVYVQNAMAAGLPVAIVCFMFRKPFILKFVGDEAWERATQNKQTEKFLEDFLGQPEGNWKIRFFIKIQGFVLRRASIVTTPSQYLGEALVKNYKLKSERVVTNYNASESDDQMNGATVAKIPHQILTTARLTKWKGVDGILEAIKILKVKYSDIMCIVCGDGPELENLKCKAKELNVEHSVRFLGKVSREETFKRRKESTVYVLNSTYEGLPHTALTSFQAGIPIVATDTPGTNEAVYDEISGLLVPVNSPELLARSIERIFEDKNLSNKLVNGGTEILISKFSWQSHINNLNKMIESLT